MSGTPERRAVTPVNAAATRTVVGTYVAMTRSRSLLGMLVLLTASLVVAAAWLVLHNPSIDGTSRGDGYPCLAPYDTVLNDADNVPGGEPAPDGDEIGTRCRSLGQKRFNQGLAAGSAAVVLGAVTMLLAVRRVRI